MAWHCTSRCGWEARVLDDESLSRRRFLGHLELDCGFPHVSYVELRPNGDWLVGTLAEVPSPETPAHFGLKWHELHCFNDKREKTRRDGKMLESEVDVPRLLALRLSDES